MLTRRLLPLLLLLGACRPASSTSEVMTAGNAVGQYKGFYAINTTISQRMISQSYAQQFNLGSYFGDNDAVYDGNVDGLAGLLGAFKGQGASNSFRNGQPNAMNMLLWDIALSGVAADAASLCPPPGVSTPTSSGVTFPGVAAPGVASPAVALPTGVGTATTVGASIATLGTGTATTLGASIAALGTGTATTVDPAGTAPLGTGAAATGSPGVAALGTATATGFGTATAPSVSTAVPAFTGSVVLPPFGSQSYLFQSGAAQASILPVCAWPAASAKQPAVLANLWYAVMGYDAPQAELAAWQAAFLDPQSPFANVSGPEAVRGLLKALFLNPSFLLED